MRAQRGEGRAGLPAKGDGVTNDMVCHVTCQMKLALMIR